MSQSAGSAPPSPDIGAAALPHRSETREKIPVFVVGPFEDNEWRRRSARWWDYSKAWSFEEASDCKCHGRYTLDLHAVAADPRWAPGLGHVINDVTKEEIANCSFDLLPESPVPVPRTAIVTVHGDGGVDAHATAAAAMRKVNLLIRRRVSWTLLDYFDRLALQDATFKPLMLLVDPMMAAVGSSNPESAELLQRLFSADYVVNAEFLTSTLLHELQLLIVDVAASAGSLPSKVRTFQGFEAALKWKLQKRKDVVEKANAGIDYVNEQAAEGTITEDQRQEKIKLRREYIAKLIAEQGPDPTLEDILRAPSESLREQHDDMFGGLRGCTPVLDAVAHTYYLRFVGRQKKSIYSPAAVPHRDDYFSRAVDRLLADESDPTLVSISVPRHGTVTLRVVTREGLQRILCLNVGVRNLGVHGQTWQTLEGGGALSESDRTMGDGDFREEHLAALPGGDAEAATAARNYLSRLVDDARAERETFTVGREFIETASSIQTLYARVLTRCLALATRELLADEAWADVWRF